VLYGQGTPGGLIDMVSKMPTEQPRHELQFEYGSFDHRQIKADLSGPLDGQSGSDTQWLYRLTALAHDNLTQIDFTNDKRVFIALTSALLGDGLWDACSCLALGLPLAVIVWKVVC
jgi:iron complex outermembrane receptor protein